MFPTTYACRRTVFFRTKSRGKFVGYGRSAVAYGLRDIPEHRDDCLAKDGKLPATHEHIIRACDAVMRGLARVGIVALVYEATGYQDVRDRKAHKLIDSFLRRLPRKELAAWGMAFPKRVL